jgi:hypothetical protein
MAVHFTLYLEEQAAEHLRRFMAGHACSATKAVELLLRRVTPSQEAPAALTLSTVAPPRVAVA